MMVQHTPPTVEIGGVSRLQYKIGVVEVYGRGIQNPKTAQQTVRTASFWYVTFTPIYLAR